MLRLAASGWYFSSSSFFCFSAASDPGLRLHVPCISGPGQANALHHGPTVFLRRNRFCIEVEATPGHAFINGSIERHESGLPRFELDPPAPKTFRAGK